MDSKLILLNSLTSKKIMCYRWSLLISNNIYLSINCVYQQVEIC